MLKYIATGLAVIIIAFLSLFVFACCRVSGACSRMEEAREREASERREAGDQ